MWRMTIFTLFFRCFRWKFWICRLCPKAKKPRIGPFPWKRSEVQNPDRERTNQSTGICLGLGLPCNKVIYLYIAHILTGFDSWRLTLLFDGKRLDFSFLRRLWQPLEDTSLRFKNMTVTLSSNFSFSHGGWRSNHQEVVYSLFLRIFSNRWVLTNTPMNTLYSQCFANGQNYGYFLMIV